MKKHIKIIAIITVFITTLVLTPFTPGSQSIYAAKKNSAAIKLLSPIKGKTVNITNKKVRKWWKNYKKYSAASNKKIKELTNPVPVTLKWKAEKGFSYKVYVSTTRSFDKAKVYKTKKGSVKIRRLLRNQKYYWKVQGTKGKKTKRSRISTFKTNNIVRIIRVSGVSNFRDLGGYETYDNSHVKQGLLYRCATLDKINSSGRKTIKKTLRIKTDLDLRRPGEGTAGTKSPARIDYVNCQGTNYVSIFRDDRKECVYKSLKVFTDPDNYPIVFHCTYGRDRTGTLAFLINGLLGVKKKDLYRDYELTYLSNKGSTSAKKRIKRFDTFYKKMASYKDAAMPLSYNIEAYMLDIGITEQEIDQIKTIMLEPAQIVSEP